MIVEADKLELICSDLSELEDISRKIISFASETKVWAFRGEMGAGKTTLIRAICSALQVTDNISSPTFSLVNEYQTINGETIYHFDFYRIRNEREALDMGAEEYFYSGNQCLIEWPSMIEGLVPEERLEILIEPTGNTSERKIQLLKKL